MRAEAGGGRGLGAERGMEGGGQVLPIVDSDIFVAIHAFPPADSCQLHLNAAKVNETGLKTMFKC